MVLAKFYKGYKIAMNHRTRGYDISRGDQYIDYALNMNMALIIVDELTTPE